MTAQFYQAGFFDGPIGDYKQSYVIPVYECPTCKSDTYGANYSYPLLDPKEVLSPLQIKQLGPKLKAPCTNEEMLEIVDLLRKAWKVPIASATFLGPTRLKVTQKPKFDFYVLPNHAGLFCRTPAVLRLLAEGFTFQYVKTECYGKHGEIADFCELAVPVMGHSVLPEGYTFCQMCLRFTPGKSFKTALVANQVPHDQPFFKTLEKTAIIFSGTFIETIRRLGITGLIEGDTLLPVLTMHDGGLAETRG